MTDHDLIYDLIYEEINVFRSAVFATSACLWYCFFCISIGTLSLTRVEARDTSTTQLQVAKKENFMPNSQLYFLHKNTTDIGVYPGGVKRLRILQTYVFGAVSCGYVRTYSTLTFTDTVFFSRAGVKAHNHTVSYG